MTADVAALAAALHECCVNAGTNEHAQHVIERLAAQGWSLYRNPTVSEMSADPADPNEGMDDPVSAQAAPGYATGGNDDAPSTRTQAAPEYGPCPDGYHAAIVRAALEGLRAEVAALDEATFASVWRADVLRAIDARMAALR